MPLLDMLAGRKAFAFLRDDMNQPRPFERAHRLERFDELRQVVTVESEVLRGKGAPPFRIVKSIAMLSAGALPAAVQSRLRRANGDYDPLEPWQVVKYKDGTAAEFQLFAEADCSDLEDIIHNVAQDTDKMELEITGGDEF